MQISPFKLERYFAAYEFSVNYLLSASDCESLGMQELLGMADADSLALWQDLRLGYTESQGHPLLREAVTRLYQAIDPDQVLVAVPEEAIFLAMNALLKPGDHVVAIYPAYQSLYELAGSLGCAVTRWTLEPGQGGWKLDLAGLERAIGDKTRLIVVNFPHNPTGFLPPRGLLEEIVALAARRGIYVFSDEMYRLLEYSTQQTLPPVCDLYERAVSLSGLSKSFALSGLRIGWLATRDRDLLARCAMLKDYTTICSSAPAEILAIVALRARDRILRRNLDIIQANLQVAGDFFARHSSLFGWLAPQAGSVALPRWAGDGPVEAFCQALLERESVMLLPGSVFDFGEGYFRLGLGRRNFAAGLDRVSAYLARR